MNFEEMAPTAAELSISACNTWRFSRFYVQCQGLPEISCFLFTFYAQTDEVRKDDGNMRILEAGNIEVDYNTFVAFPEWLEKKTISQPFNIPESVRFLCV